MRTWPGVDVTLTFVLCRHRNRFNANNAAGLCPVTAITEKSRRTSFIVQILFSFWSFEKKVQIGNDQEMAQSERNSHSINRGVRKT